MFDPEDVELFSMGGYSLGVGEEKYAHKVLKSDYDQLLELYNAEIKSKPATRIIPYRGGYVVFGEDFHLIVGPKEKSSETGQEEQ